MRRQSLESPFLVKPFDAASSMGQPSDILSDYIGRDDVLGGRYVIEEQIGGGAYGAIYLAFDRESHEQVAVKALPPQGEGSSDTAIGRFERELKVVRNLKHPNIVEVLDYGETDDSILYMIMEYIQGRTLDHRVASEGALPLDETLSITRQMAAALGSAHDKGVIHRDLKPANIMLERGVAGPNVKMLDFGMAKLVAKLGDESIVALTREGVAVGTPRYIAPEQARGSDRIGPWTDLYALGLLLYEMVTGEKAVQHDSVESAVAEHVDPEPLEMRRLSEAPSAVRELVLRLTEKDLDARLESASDVLREIDEMEGRRFEVEREEDLEMVPAGVSSATGESESSAPEASAVEETLKGYGGRMESPPEGPGSTGSPASSESPPRGTSPPPEEATPPPRERGADSDAPGAAKEGVEEGDGEEMELDWDRYKEHAPAEYDPERARWKRRGVGGRFSKPVRLVGASALFVVTTLFALMTLGAQFSAFGTVTRALLALAPLGVALMSLTGVPSHLRGRQFYRFAAVSNAVGIVVAHLVAPARLVKELRADPTWFLQFLEHVPGGPAVIDVVAWFARSYASLLVEVFGVGGAGGPGPPLP